ncbi:unnamed protein product, partial [Nippostrongylus brasiliensis]|uniref:IRG-type G domain-containing protein n=1 Tax=Nippostrongylus brasiliensis TaxID=27835 RepID=A0A0N4YMC4_NIPBR
FLTNLIDDVIKQGFHHKRIKPRLSLQWRDKAVSLEGETPTESATKRLQFLRDVALTVQTMNNETREDIRSQFPTAVNLTEGFGFTVLTTIAMIVQKVMESFNSIGATTAPQDCPVM